MVQVKVFHWFSTLLKVKYQNLYLSLVMCYFLVCCWSMLIVTQISVTCWGLLIVSMICDIFTAGSSSPETTPEAV